MNIFLSFTTGPLATESMFAWSEVKWSDVAQSCPTLCIPVDCSLQGSSVHVIFQARVLEWVAISFSRGSSWPRNRTQVSHIAGRCFTIWATRDVCLLGFSFVVVVFLTHCVYPLADYSNRVCDKWGKEKNQGTHHHAVPVPWVTRYLVSPSSFRVCLYFLYI